MFGFLAFFSNFCEGEIQLREKLCSAEILQPPKETGMLQF